jgi:hypothetical protein
VKNIFIRALIAVIAVWLIWQLVPLVLTGIGFAATGNILSIFRLVVAIVALYYIVWGPPVNLPPVN